ncbi:MAG: phage major capsid protein [Pseudoclavibacter sp.]
MSKPITLTAYTVELAADSDTRTIRGRVALYDTPTDDRRGLVIKSGALTARQPLDRTKLLRDHDSRDPLGYMTAFDPATLDATFYLPEGENGDRALAEANDKLRDGLSIGFTVTEHSFDDDGNLNVLAGLVNEVSLCAIPAFIDAGVQSVRMSAADTNPDKENNTMPEATLTTETLDERLDAHAADLDRRMNSTLAQFDPTPAAPAELAWNSYGEFVQSLARREQTAIDFYTEFEGGSFGDTGSPSTWIGDAIHYVEARRPVINLFTRDTLPAKGMTMEYLKENTDTTQVAKQEAEGDTLAFGKVSLTSASTSIDTYGGYTTMSRQTIERASTPYVSTAFRRMLAAYARATELAVRTKLTTLITEQVAEGNALTGSTELGAYDWLDLVVDAAETIDDRGFALDGLLVSKDIFKQLIRLETSGGDQLVHVSGTSVNQVGSIDLTGLRGDLASVQFRLLPGAADGTAAFFDKQAFTTWENGNAPMQLTDGSAIDLTETFAYYGYLAAASQYPTALLPIDGLTAGA